jgi:hypothetical protein
MASLYGAAIRRSALVVCVPFDRGSSCQTLSTAGAKSFRISPSIPFGVLIIPKKQKQEQNIGRTFKVHRKNARKESIWKVNLKPRLRRKMESRDESTESEKQFFSWRIKKGDSVMNRKDAIRARAARSQRSKPQGIKMKDGTRKGANKKCGTMADGREFVEAAIRDLAAEGFIRDSGRKRNGQIVWVCTGKPYPGDDDPKAGRRP